MSFTNLLLTIGLVAIPTFAFIRLAIIVWSGAQELFYPPHVSPQASPQDYGLTAEAVSFQNHAGQTLRGWFIPTSNAKGTIVFAHGYAADCTPDLIYAPLFFRAGYNSLFFDFHGHGASDGNSTSLVYYERNDLLCALDFLRSRGITLVGLVGFSMGGAIAIATAPLSPMVVGVISDCTFAKLEIVVESVAIKRGYPHWLAIIIGWLVVVVASIRLRANLFSANPVDWVDKISPRPVLIMHGDQDTDAPVQAAHLLFNAAREPKQLWIVPNATHRKIEEVAREEYRKRIVDFFDSLFNAV